MFIDDRSFTRVWADVIHDRECRVISLFEQKDPRPCFKLFLSVAHRWPTIMRFVLCQYEWYCGKTLFMMIFFKISYFLTVVNFFKVTKSRQSHAKWMSTARWRKILLCITTRCRNSIVQVLENRNSFVLFKSSSFEKKIVI